MYKSKAIKHSAREFILSENHTLEGLNIITQPINDEMVLANITNPYTGKPYEGLLVGGVFAEMDIVNNNNRFYSEENYVPFVGELREQIFSTRGVYGCLEHPDSYATNSKDISHKLIDIFYNPSDKKVYGLVLILNTPNGLIAQEVFKSGGALAVSARAGGKEIKQSNGTLKSEISMLITFDLVYHPGFSGAVMEHNIDVSKYQDGYLTLNESENFNRNSNNGHFSYITYKDGETVSTTQLFEGKRLSKEQREQQKKQGNVLEQDKPATKSQLENALSASVDEELHESLQNKINQIFLDSDEEFKKMLDKYYFDGSAGFLENGGEISSIE